MKTTLHNRFTDTFSSFEIDDCLIQNAWNQLNELYSEQHRFYHNWIHIEYLLQQFDSTDCTDSSIELAIWFHDCIYDPRANDNEQKSAELFRNTFEAHLPKEITQDVVRLILATDPKLKRSMLPDEALLIDIDLSVLGSSAEDYQQYQSAIRKEYAFVTLNEYTVGRCAVLQSIMNNRIYKTKHFENLEDRARQNLKNEIRFLKEQI